jgi:hypothetical protein
MMLPVSFLIAPFAIIAGAVIQISNQYRPTNAVGWIVTIVGIGIMSLLDADSSTGKWVGYQFLASIGTGIMVSLLHVLATIYTADVQVIYSVHCHRVSHSRPSTRLHERNSARVLCVHPLVRQHLGYHHFRHRAPERTEDPPAHRVHVPVPWWR